MVDEWEAAQPGYSRTLTVMRRLRTSLEDIFGDAGATRDSTGAGGAAAPVAPQSVGQQSLMCDAPSPDWQACKAVCTTSAVQPHL